MLSHDYAQLRLLGITNVLYLSVKRFEEVDKAFDTTWIEVNEPAKEIIDFDEASMQLQNLIASGKKVLVFCPSGQVSGALAIKWAMDTNKMFTKEIATAFVMQRRYELKDMQPWLFA